MMRRRMISRHALGRTTCWKPCDVNSDPSPVPIDLVSKSGMVRAWTCSGSLTNLVWTWCMEWI